MIECPNCKTLNSNYNKFCGECGHKLPKPANYCIICEKTFTNGEKFCTICGEKLIKHLSSEEIEELLIYAKNLYHEKQFQEAIPYFEEYIEYEPYSEEAWNLKGLCYMNLEEYDNAMGCCDKIIEINPYSTKSWTGKGSVYLKMKMYDDAKKCFFEAIKLNDHDVVAWRMMGICFDEEGKYVEAINCFNNALSINPNDLSRILIQASAYQLNEMNNQNNSKNSNINVKRCPKCNLSLNINANVCFRCGYKF